MNERVIAYLLDTLDDGAITVCRRRHASRRLVGHQRQLVGHGVREETSQRLLGRRQHQVANVQNLYL